MQRFRLSVLILSLFANTLFAHELFDAQPGKIFQPLKSQQPAHMAKLDTYLYQMLQQNNLKSLSQNPVINMRSDSRLLITLRVHQLDQALLQRVEDLGVIIETSTLGLAAPSNQQSIEVWALLNQLEALARLPEVFQLRPSYQPQVNTGRVTSEGDQIMQATQIRATTGLSGSGQTIGVLSDGVDHLVDAQNSGDLPNNVGVLNNSLGCIAQGTDCTCQAGTPGCNVTDEGTAMLEIVHDLAPGANILFNDAGTSPQSFAQRIQALADSGSKIIVDDISWFNSPFYEDGVIANTINNLTLNNDVIYFSSAGNQALRHYESSFSDPNANGFHNFIPEDEGLGFILPAGASVTLFMQWNNRWGLAADDYDVYLADDNSQFVAGSEFTQNGTGDPFEFIRYTNPTDGSITLRVAVRKFRETDADREFTLYLLDGAVGLQYLTPGAVNGHQAALHCLATATINAQDPGNDDLAPYSNNGPARLFNYDAAGQPISLIERAKPDITGIDGVLITGAGGFGATDPSGSGNRLFFGTSAAAPHAAAVAALLRQAAPQLSAVQIADAMRNSANDLGPSGFDAGFGAGLVNAFAGVQQVCPSCVQSTNTDTRLINISTLGFVDNQGMAAGFIVQGSGRRQIVILAERANSAIDPVLELVDLSDNSIITQNDDWQTHPSSGQLRQLLPLLGRSSGELNHPFDAGFTLSLEQGVYAARMRSNSIFGSGIVAINDLSSDDGGTTRLINISTLGFVDSTGMAAGFIVQGPAARDIVILAERFESDIDPTLELFDGNGALITQNDDWEQHSSAGLLRQRLPLLGRNNQLNHPFDAGVTLTLNQGVYIVRMRSRSNVGSGIVAVNDVTP